MYACDAGTKARYNSIVIAGRHKVNPFARTK
jgi:hypothetical protein